LQNKTPTDKVETPSNPTTEMTAYELDLYLPDRGDAHVTFSASYSFHDRSWEVEDITAVLVDDEDAEAFELTSLDASSALTIQCAVDALLETLEPTEREVREYHEDARGDYEYDCWRDAQLCES
jgi:hypothetical protein